MASYAFKNKERTERIAASEAVYLDHGFNYYCPNPACNARMHIVQASVPYFAANQAAPHIEHCFYASKSAFDPGKYDENSFDLGAVIRSLFAEGSPTSKTSVKQYKEHEHSCGLPIKTLRVLYDMCKSKGIDQLYNGFPINKIIYDSRCQGELSQTINGFRIVECEAIKGKLYDKDQLSISLRAPATSPQNGTFVLLFNDKNLFWERQNLIFSNRDKIIIVAGMWESGADARTRYTQVINKKQIIVIK